MPELQVIYDKNSRGQNYEDAQKQITGKEDYSQLGKYRQIRMTFFRNFIIRRNDRILIHQPFYSFH